MGLKKDSSSDIKEVNDIGKAKDIKDIGEVKNAGGAKDITNIKNIKAFLFDMDGTLLDTERIYYNFWFELSRERGFKLSDELLSRMRGTPIPIADKIFSEVNPEYNFVKERSLRTKRVIEYLDKNGIPKKPGMDEVLNYLRARGYSLALASSTPEAQVRHYLDMLGMKDFFDLVLAGDMVKMGKPHPDIFLKCAEQLGFSPEQCVVVEDSKNGVIAGYRAGCYVIGIPDLNDFSSCHQYIDIELKSLFDIITLFTPKT